MTVSQPVLDEPSLSMLVQMRPRTDVEIPPTWLLLPLASYLVWAAFAIAGWTGGPGFGTVNLGALGVINLGLGGVLGLIGILGLISSAGSSYVLYRLVNRINTHSARTQILLSKTIGALESRIGSLQGAPALLPLSSSEGDLLRLAHSERERSAVLWALLALIPFVGWIFIVGALWLLSRDFSRHERWEGVVLEDVDRALIASGLQGIQVANVQTRSRVVLGTTIIIVSLLELLSAFIFGILGASVFVYLTLGVFSLVWIDLSIRDPGRHFHYHSMVENDIVRVLPDSTVGSAGAV
jgi:hypothetical protein